MQAVAVLGPGNWVGGGATIYGSGPIQSALRVVAKGAVQVAISCRVIFVFSILLCMT